MFNHMRNKDLLTPQELINHLKPKLHYQEVLPRKDQDKLIARFTRWFNRYLKLRADITDNTKEIAIPLTEIPSHFLYYDNYGYKLLDILEYYLLEHEWNYKYSNFVWVRTPNGSVATDGLVLKFDCKKYLSQNLLDQNSK